MSQGQNRYRLPHARPPRKVVFKVEVKGYGRDARARVARIAFWGNGRTVKSTWFVAQFIEGFHEWWDQYRARKVALGALQAAGVVGGGL
jgi:hypothetical protein